VSFNTALVQMAKMS